MNDELNNESDHVPDDELVDGSAGDSVGDSANGAAPNDGSTPHDEDSIESLLEEKQFLLDQLNRSRAELANFRRRTADQQLQRERRVTSRVFQSVIPLVDDLLMARQAGEGAGEEAHEQLRKGIELIVDKFGSVLREFGIDAIATVGQTFDPLWHEALMNVETEEHSEGDIIAEFVRGYRMGDDLIRAARVSVAKTPVQNVEED